MTDLDETVEPHQPRDTLASTSHTQAEPTLDVHSPRSVGGATWCESRCRGHQRPISGRARRGPAAAPIADAWPAL